MLPPSIGFRIEHSAAVPVRRRRFAIACALGAHHTPHIVYAQAANAGLEWFAAPERVRLGARQRT
jgi:hypothetical protein